MTRKLLAEIVGPAGSGKSALSEVLSARDKTIRAGFGVWRLPSPLLILHAMLSLPHAFRLSRNYWREDEFKLMIRLSALQQLLGSKSVRNYKALVMDEGAIFALVKLRTFRTRRAAQRTASYQVEHGARLPGANRRSGAGRNPPVEDQWRQLSN
jgi:hypothetical protein